MKLNAICIIKNEADIIIDTLNNALKFCDNIFIFDNDSDDGSWELIQQKAAEDSRIIIAARTSEIYKNQFRNRVYNMFHQEFSASDWWYILDADELLIEDPRPMLVKAMQHDKNQMRVWQAQFYFTDEDLKNYDKEDKQLGVPERRRYYRINWREPRFFRNFPTQKWDEKICGKAPPFCSNLYHPSPICRHYAERTPEQIRARRELRVKNPYSFLHVKNKPIDDWLKKANDCFYYQPGLQMKFPLTDRLCYYLNQSTYWINWRFKNLMALKQTISKRVIKVFG
jgi:glycosyltransferase involved in cell wall biosynthesis